MVSSKASKATSADTIKATSADTIKATSVARNANWHFDGSDDFEGDRLGDVYRDLDGLHAPESLGNGNVPYNRDLDGNLYWERLRAEFDVCGDGWVVHAAVGLREGELTITDVGIGKTTASKSTSKSDTTSKSNTTSVSHDPAVCETPSKSDAPSVTYATAVAFIWLGSSASQDSHTGREEEFQLKTKYGFTYVDKS